MARTSLLHSALLMVLTIASCHEGPTNPAGAGPQPGGPSLVVVSSTAVFTWVGVGNAHTCASRTDGFVECFGHNLAGQAPAARAAASGTFTEVGGGVVHSCALRSDGMIECWGNDVAGQAPATKAAASGTFTQLAVGGFHTCALRGDGVVECWGGQGFFNHGQAPATRAASTGVFTQVSAGRVHSCALRNDGVVECWGAGGGVAPPTKTAIVGTFIQVSAGQDHSCALRSDGVVECFGFNFQGQGPPTRAAASGSFTQVSAGPGHTCAVRDDGVAECWGDNGSGQAPPTKAAASGTFTQVRATSVHTCALRSDGVVECWGNNGIGQGPPTKAASPTLHLLPTASFSAAPAPVVLGQSFTLALTNPQVPGYAGAVTFSYAFDCGDGNGYGAFGTSSSATCPTSAIGNRTVKGTVQDQDGDQTEYSGSVAVIYAFGGFLGPVDAPPVFNLAKAGAAVPAKFDLGGDLGIGILAPGYPRSQPTGCDVSSPADPIEETVTAGSSGLSYDATTGLYTYVWKTEKAWANTCRVLTVRLVDGTDHAALFRFSR